MHRSIAIASFNIHGGVDGWGRPYDVTAALRTIDADVLIVAENLVADDGTSIASRAAAELGYAVVETPFTPVKLSDPFAPTPDEPRWGPPGLKPPVRSIRYPDAGSPPWRRTTAAEERVGSTSVTFGLAVLCRLPHSASIVRLPRLLAEPSRRSMIVLEVPLEGGRLAVAGTHLGHLTHGSPIQMLAAGRALRGGPPTVLGGDMNCWGPLLLRFLPGFRRSVRGPTWPAWRPRHQIDHLLVTSGVTYDAPQVLSPLGSDHLAVRVVASVGNTP